MALNTANHLLVTTTWQVQTGPWAGETASWGVRVAAQSNLTTDGQVNLLTWLTDTLNSSGSVTVNGRTFTELKTWQGGDWHGDNTKKVSATDEKSIVDKFEAMAFAVKAYMPTNVKLRDIKTIAPGPDGKAHTGSNTWTPSTPYAGTMSQSLPIEDCICASFYSAFLHKSGRGRIYLGPIGAAQVSDDGSIPSVTTSAIATTVAAALSAVRAVTPSNGVSGYSPIIWSRVNMQKGAVISRVRVGDEMDQHETRGKQRPEVFSSVNVT